MSLSTLLFFSQIVLGILGLLYCPVSFRIVLSISAKEPTKILIGIALVSIHQFESVATVTVLNLLIHACGIWFASILLKMFASSS